MANIKFYRSQNAPSNPVEGYVWFNIDERTINLYKNGAWEKYAGIISATYENNILSITPTSGNTVTVDLSDLSALRGDMTTVQAALALLIEKDTTIEGKITTLETTVGNENSGLVKDVKAIQDELNSLSGGAGSIGTQIENAIATLDVTDTAVDGEYVSSVSEVDGKVVVTRAALPDYTNVYEAKGEAAKVLGTEGDTSDKMTVHGLDKRIDAIETVIGGEDADNIINNVSEVIKYFENVKEEEAGAALLSTVAGHTTAIEGLQNNKIESVTDNATYVEVSKDGTAIVVNDTALQTKFEEVYGEIESNERVIAESLNDVNGRVGELESWKTNLPDFNANITSAIEGLDSTATASTTYATVTIAEVDGKIVNDGSSISLTMGAMGSTNGLATTDDVKSYVDNMWAWGEF